MNTNANSLNWFEISVTDFERAKKFYETIFGITMETMTMGDNLMGFFPYDPAAGKVGGAIVKSDWHKPSAEGTLVYLNGNPDLQNVLDKVEAAGGKITMPKTHISDDIGYMAFFFDTEGNNVGLHSNK